MTAPQVVRGVAVVPVLIALAIAVHTGFWIHGSVPVTATVVDTVMRWDRDSPTPKARHFPVVEYADASGAVHRFTGRVSWNESGSGAVTPSGWKRGARVQVRYDARDPAHAKLAGVWGWFLPGVLIGIAAMMLLSSFGMPD